MNDKIQELFEEAAKPLIAFLCENLNPHAAVIVDCNSAQLFESSLCFQTDEYLKD